VQYENHEMSQKYLELEEAWSAKGNANLALVDRCRRLEEENAAAREALEKAAGTNRSLETRLTATRKNYADQRELGEEAAKTLLLEQTALGRAAREQGVLREESKSSAGELRELRQAWKTREARLQRVEKQRDCYEQQLNLIGGRYAGMVAAEEVLSPYRPYPMTRIKYVHIW